MRVSVVAQPPSPPPPLRGGAGDSETPGTPAARGAEPGGTRVPGHRPPLAHGPCRGGAGTPRSPPGLSVRSRKQLGGQRSPAGTPGIPPGPRAPPGSREERPCTGQPPAGPGSVAPAAGRGRDRGPVLGGDTMGTPRRWHPWRHRKAGRRLGSCGGQTVLPPRPLLTGSPAETDLLVVPPQPQR